MALLFYSQFDDPADWGKHLRDAMPGLDFRVWPEVGNPKDIDAALVWKAPEGELRKFPNLKLIINLGAGVDSIVKDRSLPGNSPKSIPSRIMDSRFMVSLEEMMWALARVP